MIADVDAVGVPALSNQPCPFRDVWKPITAMVSVFGPQRTMWGSDYNPTSPLHTYREAMDNLAEIDVLDAAVKEALYAETSRALFRCPAPASSTVAA